MDLGIFKRSRLCFWTWVLAPLLAIGAVSGASTYVSRSTQQALTRRHTYIKSLPQMEARLARARDALQQFILLAPEGMGEMEALGTAVQETAEQAQFTINSLTTDQAECPHASECITSFQMVVKGEGTLSSIMRFSEAVRSRHPLLIVDTARLRTVALRDDMAYEGEIVLVYHKVAT